MKTEIIVLGYKHYSMENMQGLNVLIFGSNVETNNEAGAQVTQSQVLDYEELHNLKAIDKDNYPAKFEAEMEFTKVKDKGGKEKTGIAFKNLNYVCSMKLVEDKKKVS